MHAAQSVMFRLARADSPDIHLSSTSFFHSQVESDERCNIRSEIVY